jgi:hypothetical protein
MCVFCGAKEWLIVARSLGELVTDGENGRIFNTAADLADQLAVRLHMLVLGRALTNAHATGHTPGFP